MRKAGHFVTANHGKYPAFCKTRNRKDQHRDDDHDSFSLSSGACKSAHGAWSKRGNSDNASTALTATGPVKGAEHSKDMMGFMPVRSNDLPKRNDAKHGQHYQC
jgi:hypothetical protein